MTNDARKFKNANKFFYGSIFNVGDKVKLKSDVLQRHARSVPAQCGYTHNQFLWRDTLARLIDKVGTIERTFATLKNTTSVNVLYEDGTLIGIDTTELDKI